MGWLLHALFLAKKYCLGTSSLIGFRSISTLHIGETCVEMRPTHVKVFKLLLTSETFRFNFATSLLRPHFTSLRLLYLTWHQICENLRNSGSESLACSLFITWTILICREPIHLRHNGKKHRREEDKATKVFEGSSMKILWNEKFGKISGKCCGWSLRKLDDNLTADRGGERLFWSIRCQARSSFTNLLMMMLGNLIERGRSNRVPLFLTFQMH